MGTTIETVGKEDGRNDGIDTVKTGRNEGQSGGDSSTASSGSTGGRTGGSSGESERTTTGGSTGEKEKELDRLSILSEEERKQYDSADEKERKRLLKNAYKRKQYAENKAKTGQGKPRKTRRKKTEETLPLDTASLNMIFATLSSVIASRPNCEHWLLNEKEIQSITTPLNNLLKESEAFKNIGEYSNQIALVTACITIFVPRLIITISKQKGKKDGVQGNITKTNSGKLGGDIGKSQTSNPTDTRGNDRKPSPNSKNDGVDVPWYGVGLS